MQSPLQHVRSLLRGSAAEPFSDGSTRSGERSACASACRQHQGLESFWATTGYVGGTGSALLGRYSLGMAKGLQANVKQPYE